MPSDAEEIHDDQLTAREAAQVNAYRKARAVAKKFPDALVLGADTLVYLDGETKLFGKPASLDAAMQMLAELQGRTHAVVTGVCLLRLRDHRQQILAEWTDVRFHPLAADQIKAYLNLVNPLDNAGAYASHAHGQPLVVAVPGSF